MTTYRWFIRATARMIDAMHAEHVSIRGLEARLEPIQRHELRRQLHDHLGALLEQRAYGPPRTRDRRRP